VKRRQRAEEQAAKLAVKMVVPMVVFIFPGVFIVILGPAFIQIVRDLLPTLAGGN
jgi:tight adherence protein C